jgi:hypothetical protein
MLIVECFVASQQRSSVSRPVADADTAEHTVTASAHVVFRVAGADAMCECDGW